jgi:hypothetical protein
MACLIGRVQNLIIEHGEVECKTKTNWVCWRKISLSNLGSILVGLERLSGGFLALLANGELSEVTVIVTLPLKLYEISHGLFQITLGTHILW